MCVCVCPSVTVSVLSSPILVSGVVCSRLVLAVRSAGLGDRLA